MSEREFQVIETQEQFDSAIQERISRLNAKHSEATAELQKQIEALGEENTSLRRSIEENSAKYAETDKTILDLQGQIKNYETASVKSRIAHETGLPFELTSMLNGETEEDIRKCAETLSKFTVKRTPAPMASTEPSGEATNSNADLKEALRNMVKKEA